MTVLFALEAAVLVLLMLLSRRRSAKEISVPDGERDMLKLLIPAGLLLLGLFRYDCTSAYEKGLERKLKALAGPGRAHMALKLHIARKLMLMYVLLMFITFVGIQTGFDLVYALFGGSLLCGVFVLTDRQLDERLKERQRSMQLEFPEFLNKLILLVNAGLTVRSAIQKIVRDNKKDNPLYTELVMTVNDINTGKSEMCAYEDFAGRCRLQEVTMFTAALIQNLRKGSDELVAVLRLQAAACWENRRNIARKLGEEASTKLIFPMIIVFIAILIMVMTPAVMQIQL